MDMPGNAIKATRDPENRISKKRLACMCIVVLDWALVFCVCGAELEAPFSVVYNPTTETLPNVDASVN